MTTLHPTSGSTCVNQSGSPLWSPTKDTILHSHIVQFAIKNGFDENVDYASLHHWSITQLGPFWSAFWDYAGIIGDKGSVIVEREGEMESTKFFPNAHLNWSENLLKRRDKATAVIFRDERGRERSYNFELLAQLVSRLQQAFQAAGVTAGDRVAGFLPNLPETLIAALAAASLGAVWSSASPDFGVQGVVDRFGQIAPKILITVDGYYYGGKDIDIRSKIKDILPHLPSVEKVIIIPFLNDNAAIDDIPLSQFIHDFMAPYAAQDPFFQRVAFNHPLFIMFSSGTTGAPKCIVHGHGGTLLQHMKEHQLQCNIKNNDRVFYFTTCGWMMWNWQISALASGACLLLYDGSPFYPDPYALWDYTDQHEVTLFGTGAKYIDALRDENCSVKDHFKLENLRTITSTGSPLVHESFDYVYNTIKSDVHLASISGGTDIISCFVIGNVLSPVWRGEIQGAGLGYAINVFDENGKPIKEIGSAGEMVCTRPFPSMPICFWNDEGRKRYHKAYFDRFPNIWCHGDWIEHSAHNGFIIVGRSDATLNPGGVRIGTAEIYRQVETMPEVSESLAVGQAWNNDERVILFVRLKMGVILDEALKNRIKQKIRSGASPRHVPSKIIAVADIPRTKSNKIVELAVKEIIHDRPVRNIHSLANPESLELYRNLEELRT